MQARAALFRGADGVSEAEERKMLVGRGNVFHRIKTVNAAAAAAAAAAAETVNSHGEVPLAGGFDEGNGNYVRLGDSPETAGCRLRYRHETVYGLARIGRYSLDA